MSKEYVIEKIKEWRRKNHKSRNQLAKEHNVSLKTWFKIENQRGVISGTTAKKISKITQIDINLIMELAEPEDIELERIAKKYNDTHPFLPDLCARERLLLLKQNS